MKNWSELATGSHYITALEVQKSLVAGDVADAEEGIDQLIAAMARADRRAVQSQLVRLMKHIIKWHTQPTKRTTSWAKTIRNARNEIHDIQEDTPSITNDMILDLWERAFMWALAEAEEEMGNQPSALTELTWNQVFDDEYLL